MSNRSKFADQISNHFRVPKKAGAEMLEVFTAALQAHLTEEGQAVFPGFGRLKVQIRPARQGRNPRTGATIQIASKPAFKFKAFPAKADETN